MDYMLINIPAEPLSGLPDMHTRRGFLWKNNDIRSLLYLLDTITPNHAFRQKVKALITKYLDTDTVAMGFPKDWNLDPFWE
jgi:hypothetical protein